MKTEFKEILLGLLYGFVTIICLLGITPWTMVSSILGCVVAMFAIIRIRKRKNEEKPVAYFTVSYMAVIIVCVLLINSISISA